MWTQRWFYTLPLRLRSLLQRRRVEGELEEEFQFHVEQKTEQYIARGLDPEEARHAAMRDMDGPEQRKEECRDMRRLNFVNDLVQDLRYGFRMMRRSRGFTMVAVLSLALGIGATTAIFSLVNAVMLKMLPVKHPEQLVVIDWRAKTWPRISHSGNTWGPRGGPITASSISYPAFRQLRAQNQVLSDLFVFADLEQAHLTVDGYAEIASGHLVSGNYFSGLGVQAVEGRTFTDQDDRPDAEPVAVISFRYWNRRFGMDPAAVGKRVEVNSVPVLVIGVTPREFFGVSPGDYPDIWIPVSLQPRIAPQWGGEKKSLLGAASDWWVQPWGRLKPGVSEQQARAALDVIFRQSITAGLSSPLAPESMASIQINPGSRGLDDLRSEFSQPALILMSVVGLVLLIACANVANLPLARAIARQREAAVRLALGAGRLRLVRQSFTESVLLASLGGALGLVLAFQGGELLLALMSPGETPLQLDVRPDAHILAFCVVISLLTGVLFGLAPALRSTRIDVCPVLKGAAGSVKGGSGRSRWSLSKVLVAAQVAVSLLLLIAAGLFVRSLQKLNSMDVGFNRENLLLFGIDGSLSGYKNEQLGGLYSRIQESVEALPGVRSASLSRHSLIGDGSSRSGISVPGYANRPDEEMPVYGNRVGPGFFETIGIPILLGRGLTIHDNETAPKVVVINEALARRYFSNQSPLGRRVSWNNKDCKIVGVAKDAKYHNMREEVQPTVYEPYLQSGVGRMIFEVRTAGDPGSIIPIVRRAVASVDRNLPLYNVGTQVQQIDSYLIQERLFAKLTGCFGALAMLLASIGLHGVMSYAVARRTGEIGIRMALGAQRRDVLWQVLRETMLLVAIGLIIGLPAALASTRLIRNQLFGLKPTEPFTILVATLLLVLVAVFAGYLPARRASRLDPMVALRYK